VYDPTEDPPEGIIEIKNPYSVRNLTLQEAATVKSGFCLQITKEKIISNERRIMTITIKYSVHSFVQTDSGVAWLLEQRICTKKVILQQRLLEGSSEKVETQFYFTAILPELASSLGAPNIQEPSKDFKDKHLNISS